MAENKFNLFQFPFAPLGTNREVVGPRYWRSASGVGTDPTGEDKDYYWKESYVDSRAREPLSGEYFSYYAANLGDPPSGSQNSSNDYRWTETSLSYTQNRLLKIFWNGSVVHNQTYSSIPSSVSVGNTTYKRYNKITINTAGHHYDLYRVVGAANIPTGTTENTKKVEIYWKGVKRAETTYEYQGYGITFLLDDSTPGQDYRWSRNSSSWMERSGTGRGEVSYSEISMQHISGFRKEYDYNLPARAPKPLVSVDKAPYAKHEKGEADYYLFGLRLIGVFDASSFANTDKFCAPFGVNCAISIKFPYIKRIAAGVYQIDVNSYTKLRFGTFTGSDRSYVHTLDKTKIQRVRHKYTSSGKYYMRTDQYYTSSAESNFGSSDVIYYSDTRYTCHYLGGADFYNYNPASPKKVQYAGAFLAEQTDYIFQRSKPDDWYYISNYSGNGSNYSELEFNRSHNFKNFLGYNDLYYSTQQKPNEFPINWSPPGGVSNAATNYDNYAIYPLHGYKEYRAEFPFDAHPYYTQHGTANNARPGLVGAIAPQQTETLTLDLERKVPATTYINNIGHHNNGFCVVPYGDGFGFIVNIVEPKDSFLLNVINNFSWTSTTTKLHNCTLVGDVYKSYNFTVVPIKTGEHFYCSITYGTRAQSGGAYVYFHFIVKGFAMGPEVFEEDVAAGQNVGIRSLVMLKDQSTWFQGTVAASTAVSGDSIVCWYPGMKNWETYTDDLSDSPQKIKTTNVKNCIILDDYVHWAPPEGPGGDIKVRKPIRILPTADNWSCKIFAHFGHIYVAVEFKDERYYPDMGMQVWNEDGGTRLNTTSRHPRIIYAHEGVINYPVNLTVPEFMCHFNDVPFVEDMRRHNMEVLSGGNQYDNIEYDRKRFGAACYKINRSEGAHAFKVNSSSDFAFGTGNYMIDFWFLSEAATGTIIDMRTPGGSYSQPAPRIYIDGSNRLKVYVNGSDRITIGSQYWSDNRWTHFRLQRYAGKLRAWVDGAKLGAEYTNSSNITARGFRVGTTYASEATMGGALFIDELRILKQNNSYFNTANFVPPTSQYMGNNDVTLTSTDIPELVELVDDGTWHINLSSEKGLTHVDFDYRNKEVRISKNLPAAGNVRYTSWADYARFQIMRI